VNQPKRLDFAAGHVRIPVPLLGRSDFRSAKPGRMAHAYEDVENCVLVKMRRAAYCGAPSPRIVADSNAAGDKATLVELSRMYEMDYLQLCINFHFDDPAGICGLAATN
jgi:hypothetical protein